MSTTNLQERSRNPEIMDDPDLEAHRHMAALNGLSRINRVTGSVGEVWSAIAPLIGRDHREPLRVLDIATGGGDLPIGLSNRARRRGVPLEATGCDISDRALERARNRARRTGADVAFTRIDILTDDLPEGFDVITCSLFLHHLEPAEASLALEKMRRAARRLVVVCDLRRSRSGYALAWLGSRTLSRSDVVHTDALLSVRAAFTIDEVRRLADAAGMQDAVIARRAPCRFRLVWEAT